MPATKPFPGLLKLNDTGDNVKAIQDVLNVQETGLFGTTTERFVKEFQQGKGLPASGVVDQATWEKLFPAISFREKVVAVAKSYDGVQEQPVGSNRGPEVSAFLASAGLPPGLPWCMAYVYHCLSKAAAAFRVPVPLPRSGSCPVVLNWARANHKLTTDPKPGDVFLVKDPTYGAIHTGFVLGPDPSFPTSRVRTIEGNTNSQNSAEGHGCFQRNRPINTLYFVRID